MITESVHERLHKYVTGRGRLRGIERKPRAEKAEGKRKAPSIAPSSGLEAGAAGSASPALAKSSSTSWQARQAGQAGDLGKRGKQIALGEYCSEASPLPARTQKRAHAVLPAMLDAHMPAALPAVLPAVLLQCDAMLCIRRQPPRSSPLPPSLTLALHPALPWHYALHYHGTKPYTALALHPSYTALALHPALPLHCTGNALALPWLPCPTMHYPVAIPLAPYPWRYTLALDPVAIPRR